MPKGFNYQRYLRRLQSNRAKKKERRMNSRAVAREAAKKRRQAIGAEIAKLHLPKVAQEIIRMYDVPASPSGKIFLRQELRAGFLKSFERQGARLKVKEKIALRLAKDSATVYSTLWKYRYKGIPLEEAFEMYRAAAEILKRAGAEAKGDPELRAGFGREGRNIEKTAEQLRGELARKNVGSVNSGSRKKLGEIAEVGENLVDYLCGDLPEFSQAGFQAIDKIVAGAFGEGQ